MSKMMVMVLLFVLNSLTSAQGKIWHQTNGPVGGNIRAIAVNKQGKAYAATSSGGIFKSTDDGLSWDQIDLPNRFIGCLAVSPNGTIIAGDGFGLFRSTNDGLTWLELRPNPGSGRAVVIVPLGTMFVCAGGVIFRSTDNGNSWTLQSAGLARTDIIAIAVDASKLILRCSHRS